MRSLFFFVMRAWRALLACVALRAFALAFASDASAFASAALRALRRLLACVALRALPLAFALNCVACVACVGCVIMETRLKGRQYDS